MRSVISLPDTVGSGAVMPGDTGWAQAGNHAAIAAAAPPPKAPLTNRRLSICIFFPTVTERSEEHTSELQSLMRISYAVFCLKKKNTNKKVTNRTQHKTLTTTTTYTYNS